MNPISEQEVKWLFSTLSKIKFFQSFDLTSIDSLIRKIEKYTYPKGIEIIKENTEGKAFYIIYKGRVKIWRKAGLLKKVHIAELGPGDFFGEMSLVTDELCSANVT